MSKFKADKFGTRASRTNTAQAELRIADANALLAWNSNDFQTIGQANPGSFTPNPAMDKVQQRQGVTSVATQQFMSSRDCSFSITLDETTARAKQLANASDLPPVFTLATQGYTQGTIGAGSTAIALTVSGAQAGGLTTNHLIKVKQNDGLLTEIEEERYVKNVTGDTVTLHNALSKAPAADTVIDRLAYYNVPEGGTTYEDLHVNIKNTLNDKSLNILNYPLCNIESGKFNPGANNALQGVELTFTGMAQAEDIGGVDEPVFSRNYLVPASEVAGLSA